MGFRAHHARIHLGEDQPQRRPRRSPRQRGADGQGLLAAQRQREVTARLPGHPKRLSARVREEILNLDPIDNVIPMVREAAQ
jgi:hypothetical protein